MGIFFGRNDAIVGRGDVKSESREVSFFNKLEVSGAFEVDFKTKDDFSIVVSAQENIIPFIETKVSDDILIIELSKSCSSNKKLLVEICAPNICNYDISGAVSLIVQEMVGDSDIVFDVSGAAKIHAVGVVNSLKLDISGAANVDAKGLAAKHVKASISGASKVSVFATETAEVSVSGAAVAKIFGSPKKRNSDVSGVGSVVFN